MFGAPFTITPPVGELISIESARSYLRVDGAGMDDELDMIRAAAVDDVEQLTGLRLLDQTVEVIADRFADLATLRVGPVRTVTEIAYRDSAGDDQVVAAEDYELFGAPLEQGIRLAGEASWPTAEAGSIVLTLEVGYGPAADDVPAPLRYAAYAVLRGKFEDRKVDLACLVTNFRFWTA
jgi:uncharacterized phiE125 gp8 family phage protein